MPYATRSAGTSFLDSIVWRGSIHFFAAESSFPKSLWHTYIPAARTITAVHGRGLQGSMWFWPIRINSLDLSWNCSEKFNSKKRDDLIFSRLIGQTESKVSNFAEGFKLHWNTEDQIILFVSLWSCSLWHQLASDCSDETACWISRPCGLTACCMLTSLSDVMLLVWVF